VLSTAGSLLFTGDAEGNFIALDAASGKALWHFQTGGSVHSAPISFAVDGKQYVAIAAGSALYTFGLP
jgi:alcohol dehydrogenase (cytochrome c)